MRPSVANMFLTEYSLVVVSGRRLRAPTAIGAMLSSVITHGVDTGVSSNDATNRKSRAPLTNCRNASTSPAAMMTSGSGGSLDIALARAVRLGTTGSTFGKRTFVVPDWMFAVLGFSPVVTAASSAALT